MSSSSSSFLEERLDELGNWLQQQQQPWQSASFIEEWCERSETFWAEQQRQDARADEWKEPKDESTQHEKLFLISDRLLQLVESYYCHGRMEKSKRIADEEAFLEKEREGEEQEVDNNATRKQQDELRLLLRTTKNVLRGILVMYSPTKTQHLNNIMTPWRSVTLLRRYFDWIVYYCTQDAILAQHAAQILFYASYNPVSGSDEGLLEAYTQLLNQDKIMSQLLTCLMLSGTKNDVDDQIALELSLVRNVHNTLVTFPQGVDCALAAQVTLETPQQDDFAIGSIVTFATVLPLLALRALDAEPPFPGHAQEKRAELVLEILRAAYALQLGKQLERDPQGSFSKLIVKLLRLPTTTAASKQSAECQREVIPLLMDADAMTVATLLLSEDLVVPLFDILEQQVTHVLDQTLVHDSAAAALTPILVVLHKLSTRHADICRHLKLYIFPTQSEQAFQETKRREIKQHGNCRSMKPLDAPPGTLRYKLIQLLTWPQSHIKRFTGELLWTVCAGDAQEFIARVGMGNAVVILGARGLMQLPGEMSSSSQIQ